MKYPIPEAELTDEYEKMLALVGMAITCWANIETGLCELFGPAVASRNSESAFFAMDAISSPEVRISVLNSAIRWTYRHGQKHSSHVLPAWDQMYKELHTARKLRNKIAHCQVVKQEFKGRGRVMIVPHYSVGHRISIDKFDRWNKTRINNTISYFRSLSGKVHDLAYWLMFFHVKREFPELPPLNEDGSPYQLRNYDLRRQTKDKNPKAP